MNTIEHYKVLRPSSAKEATAIEEKYRKISFIKKLARDQALCKNMTNPITVKLSDDYCPNDALETLIPITLNDGLLDASI